MAEDRKLIPKPAFQTATVPHRILTTNRNRESHSNQNANHYNFDFVGYLKMTHGVRVWLFYQRG
jgi:hypothetical protein